MWKTTKPLKSTEDISEILKWGQDMGEVRGDRDHGNRTYQ